MRIQYESLVNSEELSEILPPEKELPNILAQIEALCRHHGLFLGDISLSSGIDEDNKKISRQIDIESGRDIIGEVEVSIFVFASEGGYEKTKGFLEALETHIRLIDVTSFGFDKNMKSYNVIFKTYYLKNEK